MERTRLLKRIAFINIANTDYSSAEIAGNTCFVGTNNLGKTTLQRAILFFYNANTRGLGIASSQRSFDDYYFQYPNSYIIYEVATEDESYHVMVYRNNKICYRFVEAPYFPDLYIENQEALLLKDVLARLNQKGINYSDQIDTYERYRNILYGADPDKKYKKFALLKGNSMYHNIPLAIQAIFLSSESVIKAEFVKDCIANSISTKHTTIELKTIERQLRQFSERYQDIETFFKKENAQRGNLIKDNFLVIKNLKNKQRTLAAELGSALKYAGAQKDLLERQLEDKDSEITIFDVAFATEESAFRERVNELIGEIAVIKSKLKEADKKYKEYQERNIDELLRLVDEKSAYVNELKARESEYATLTASFKDVEQQYNTLFAALDNEKNEFETLIKGKGLELDKKFQEDKSQLLGQLQAEKENLQKIFQEETESLKEQIIARNLQLKEIEYKIRETKKKVYFETELRLIQTQLREIAEKKAARKSAIDIANKSLEGIRKESEHIQEKAALRFEQYRKENLEEIEASEDEIRRIEEKLSVYQDAFLGFLNENYPGWLETIGKVVDEDLLYKKNLDPKLLKKGLDSLYGIHLNLDNLEVQCRSLDQLEKEKSELREWISRKQQEFIDFQENHEKELQSQLSALGRKTGQLRNELDQLNYEAGQDEQIAMKLQLDKNEWDLKASQQKEKDITALYIEEQELQKESGLLKSRLEEYYLQHQSKINSLTGLYNDKLYQLKKRFEEKASELAEQKEEKLAEIGKRREKLEKEKSGFLKKKGVDREVIKELEKQISQIKEKLLLIEENNQVVSEYLKDKRELFDAIPALQNEKLNLEQRQHEEQQIFNNKKLVYDKKKEQLLEERRSISEEHRKYQEGLQHFERYFKEKSIYDRLRHIVDNAEPIATTASLIEICSQLLANDAEYHKQFQLFRNQVTDFAGRFRPDNHFNFRVNPAAGEGEYESFALQLQDFYNENRIQISIAEVAKSHGMLIDAIATKVKTLTDHKSKINRMVAKMEADFSKASFESSQLIEYIKLKSEDSENKVLRKLQKIAEFREQNPFVYGESNLFNADNKGKFDIDRKSVELLNDLLKTITEEKYEEIRVQDLFELRFRIKEGKNDTGWIEKIDKVGSTGTDMLVKAVIYITLLNVFIKESTDRTAQPFKVHCIIDEVGQISAPYLKELIRFAEERNIYLINGLPNESKLETHYNYTYKFRKNEKGNVKIIPLLSISVKV